MINELQMGAHLVKCENCDRFIRRKDNCCTYCGFFTPKGLLTADPEFAKRRQLESCVRIHGIIALIEKNT
jgi:ribosomal protein L32